MLPDTLFSIRNIYFYFYLQLFLDDAKMKNFTSCFKEKKFLEFFFKRIRLNNTGRYNDDFPFISLCGRERNFIRCDDVPIVYTQIIKKNDVHVLTYGYASDSLHTKFIPEKIYMSPQTGRVYHPADDKYGGVGLIKSKLAIELSKYFKFQNSETHAPTHLVWENEVYKLDQCWLYETTKKYNLKLNETPDSY